MTLFLAYGRKRISIGALELGAVCVGQEVLGQPPREHDDSGLATIRTGLHAVVVAEDARLLAGLLEVELVNALGERNHGALRQFLVHSEYDLLDDLPIGPVLPGHLAEADERGVGGVDSAPLVPDQPPAAQQLS